jgi:hypothetical protein
LHPFIVSWREACLTWLQFCTDPPVIITAVILAVLAITAARWIWKRRS